MKKAIRKPMPAELLAFAWPLIAAKIKMASDECGANLAERFGQPRIEPLKFTAASLFWTYILPLKKGAAGELSASELEAIAAALGSFNSYDMPAGALPKIGSDIYWLGDLHGDDIGCTFRDNSFRLWLATMGKQE